MGSSLSYSLHLGSDKNRTGRAKGIAKSNSSGTTSLSNNAIQSARHLSKANKHNLRDYDNDTENIFILYGSNNLYRDVERLYIQEFEESRIEYNEKQTRDDRKIENYFQYISQSKLWDLACEFIIELGDMEFWEDKDEEYRKKMTDVYREQVNDLIKIVPEFKVANAVIHFDETSPHMHIIGVPVSENNKRGMKKQVAKSRIFTKESLTKIQDEMRNRCIKSYNKFYDMDIKLKEKQKGRNQDINVKGMENYKEFKKQYEKNIKKLDEVNKKNEELSLKIQGVNGMLSELKSTPFSKENKVISTENIKQIKALTNEIINANKSLKNVNSLNNIIEKFEGNYEEMRKENKQLKQQVKTKDDEIEMLRNEVSLKDKIVNTLQTETEKLKEELNKFKVFWHNLLRHFQNKIGFDKDKYYEEVAEDLYNNNVFNDNENEIVKDVSRKITDKEISPLKTKKKNLG